MSSGLRAFRLRVLIAWRDDRAVHAWIISGRLLGLCGCGLLAYAVDSAHRWQELQNNWERGIPFGVLAVVFLGAGTPHHRRRLVLPAAGVAVVFMITVPNTPLGRDDPVGTAAVLSVVAGVGLLVLSLTAYERTKGRKIESFWFPASLVIGGYLGAALLVTEPLIQGGYGAAGLWCLSLLVSGLGATIWEVLQIEGEGVPANQELAPPTSGKLGGPGT